MHSLKGLIPTILTILDLIPFAILLYILKFYYDYFTCSIPYLDPFPLPIIGNLHQYFYHRNDMSSWHRQLSSRYRGIFELYFGSNKYLMISDARLVERILNTAKNNNYFVCIETEKELDKLQKENNGLLFNADLKSWTFIKKVFVKTIASPNAIKTAIKFIRNIFQNLKIIWDNLIDNQDQFLNDEQEKFVDIDFIPWSKNIFAKCIMLLIANRQFNLLSTHYNRISNINPDDQKNSYEEFLDYLVIASDCMQYYTTVLLFILTYEDLYKLKYIDTVVKEVLRVRPAMVTISCFSDNSDQIDNYKIPASTQLVINVIGLHMNPKYWKEPTKFNLSRFLLNNNKNNDTFNTNKNAFMNFGGGLCICFGKQLAIIQLKILVVLLYSKYKIEVLTKDSSIQNNINTQCNELKIRIRRRS
ncbi:cytochrome P450 [Gigaspora margarita]|uniref:Cytochrome P450 n=1 Tax=Gigaspora margarita TaxID=4874 RepID=A0A8H4A9C9_GIGMA|nr:cytochrome P450 [Gigaspora margarita]